MKILLICPTNPRFMPYLNNYLQLLEGDENQVQILIWDRFLTEEFVPELVFRRGKEQHQRGVADYYFFGKFVSNHLQKNHYDKVVCFGLQTAFFIKKVLKKRYSGNFVIDVRDHNPIIRFYGFPSLIAHSAFTVISSSGYLSWLPENGRYLINHNFLSEDLSEMHAADVSIQDHVSISSIGALRDLAINVDFIRAIANSAAFKLYFHGRGDINSELEAQAGNSFSNVEITGYYPKESEIDLYRAADLVNVLRYSDGINNRTALPNRLYLAPYFGRPLFAYEGTYLAEVIQKYHLGLVVSSFDDLQKVILSYFESFDVVAFDVARQKFLNEVIHENDVFKREFGHFLRANLGKSL